jgi:hypothetical protein
MKVDGRRSFVSFRTGRLALVLAVALMLVPAVAQGYPELPLEAAIETRLDPDNPQQWFRVELPDAGTLTVRAESETDLGFDLRLYVDQTGLHSDTGGARSERLVTRADLGAGAYLVRIDRVAGSGRVTLRASFGPTPYADDPEPNDRAEDAAALRLDAPRDGRLGYLVDGRADGDDWFVFDLAEPGAVSVAVEADETLGFDARLYAANASTVLHADTGGSRSARRVERRDLAAGRYLLRLTRVTGFGGYRVEPGYTPQPIAEDAEPNDVADQAVVVGLDETFWGQLGYTDGARTDGDDWFVFDLTDPGALAFEVQADETLGFDARLYAANASTVLHADTGGARSARRVERPDMAPGRYFLRLTRVTGFGGYRVEPNDVRQPIPTDAEPNDVAGEPVVVRPNETHWGQLGYTDGTRTDGDDWFAFDLADPGAVFIAAAADETLGFDARLYAANGSAVLHADTGGARSERRVQRSDLAPGRYFLRLTRVTGYGGYELTPAFVAASELDEREPPASAEAATALQAERVLRGLLGHTDGSTTAGDAYHRFEHRHDGPLTVVATAPATLAFDLRLYDAAGTVLRGDTGGSRAHRSLTLPALEAGAYVVRLTRVHGHGTYALAVRSDGAGVAAHPERITFPAAALGADPVVTHAAVLNAGDADVAVLGASVRGGAGFEVVSAPTGVPAGAVGAFSVAFTPTSEGPVEATLHVVTTAGELTVPLSGNGYRTYPGVSGSPAEQDSLAPDRDEPADHDETPSGPAATPAPTPGRASAAANAPAAAIAPAAAPREGILAWTSSPRYSADEAIVVHYAGLPGSTGDWITVIAADQPDDRYAEWSYTGGEQSGEMTFRALPPGDYEVRVYFAWPSGGYVVHSRYAFTVAAAQPPAGDAAPAEPPTAGVAADAAPAEPPTAGDAADVAPAEPPTAGDAADVAHLGAAQRVEHPSGAVLSAPAGTLPDGHAFSLEVLADPPCADPFVPAGPALVARSDGAPPPARAIELVLPAPSEHSAVLFHSLGEWIRVPAEPVALAGGGRGLAVRVDRVPLPWLVTVAELPPEARGSADRAAGGGVLATLARLEQLRITDPDAMGAELDRLAAERRSGSTLQHVSAAQGGDAYALLLDARLELLRAYDATHRPGGRFSARAAESYVDAIELLHAAAERLTWTGTDERNVSFSDRSALDARVQGFHREYVYGGRLTLADALDYYAGTFAPWGLGLTRALLVGEDRALGRQFDVRVLHFYGSEAFTNLLIPRRFEPEALLAHAEHQPPAVARGLREVTRELRTVNRRANATVTLRLYSPNLLDLTTDDLYRAAKSTVGGASWLYGAVSLAATAASGAAAVAAIPVGAAVVTAYGLYAPIIEGMFIEPRADRWAAEAFVSKTTSLTVYSAGKLLGSLILDAGSRGINAAPDVADMLLAYAIDYDRLARADELRGLGIWGVRNPAAWFFQSRHFYAPPIEVVFNLAGPTELRAHPTDAHRPAHWPSTFESYVVGGHGVFSVFVDHAQVTLRGLGDGIRFEPMVPYANTLFGLPLHAAPFRAAAGVPVSRWAVVNHVEEAPHVQVLRWTLNESTLEAWAATLRLDTVDELLERVTVEVRSAHGGRPYRIYGYRANRGSTEAVDAEEATLARAARAGERTNEVRAFAVAVLESDDATPRPLHEYVGISVWNERSVGDWSALMAYTPSHRYGQFELEYEVRLVAGREELLRFPVGFAYHAVDSANVLVAPTGGLANLPPRKIEVSTVRPDVAHEFRIEVLGAEHEPTHSSYGLVAMDRATTDLSGLRFTWTVVSQHGDAVAIGEQQGRSEVTLALPFDPRDHDPDPSAPPPGSSPFAVHVPVTSYTVTVEVTRGGRFVDRVERQVGVSGPYVMRIDQFGQE